MRLKWTKYKKAGSAFMRKHAGSGAKKGTFLSLGGTDLLAGLRKSHSSERRGQSLGVHFAARPLQVVILPGLRIWGLLHTNVQRFWQN